MVRWLALLVLAPLVVAAAGCRKPSAENVDRNSAPTTYVTYGPIDSTEANYRIHVYWNGVDKDGYVIGYLVAVTDSTNLPLPPQSLTLEGLKADPRFTTRTDSLFVFTANDPLVLAHRVYIAAIDNEGKLDLTALETGHFIYFLARNRFAPQVFLTKETIQINGEEVSSDNPVMYHGHLVPTLGRPDTVQSGGRVSYMWTASDRDPGSRIVGYCHQLSVPMNPICGDASLRSAFYPDPSIPPESCAVCGTTLADIPYTFSVRATDEAGAVSEGIERNPTSGEQFVIGYDPVTFEFWDTDLNAPVSTGNLLRGGLYKSSGSSETLGVFDRIVEFSGAKTYSPPIPSPDRPPQDIPYAVDAFGNPDTLADQSTLVFMFLAADSAGGDAGLVSGYSYSSQQPFAGSPPAPSTQQENYSQFCLFDQPRPPLITSGLPTFPPHIPLAQPDVYARFQVQLTFLGSNYSGLNRFHVRSRDASGRNDGNHTTYPNVMFEVNYPPRYSLPGTALQAGNETGPNPAAPLHYGNAPDGSGDFGCVDLSAPDSVLWVIFGAVEDIDARQPLPMGWIKKRAVIQSTTSPDAPIFPSAWTDGPNRLFTELAPGPYRLDVQVRDYGYDDNLRGRNWSAYCAGRLMTFSVCNSGSPSAGPVGRAREGGR